MKGWNLTDSGSTVVRASAGLYSARTPARSSEPD